MGNPDTSESARSEIHALKGELRLLKPEFDRLRTDAIVAFGRRDFRGASAAIRRQQQVVSKSDLVVRRLWDLLKDRMSSPGDNG